MITNIGNNLKYLQIINDDMGRLVISLEDFEDLAYMVAMSFVDSLDDVDEEEQNFYLMIIQSYTYLLLSLLYPEYASELLDVIDDVIVDDDTSLYS